MNITSFFLYSKVTGQCRHVNGNSEVGVCEASVWGCVCVCILVNSLSAGVCEEWIVSYSITSPCARHLNITQSLKSSQTNQKSNPCRHWHCWRTQVGMNRYKDFAAAAPASVESYWKVLGFFVLNWVLEKKKLDVHMLPHGRHTELSCKLSMQSPDQSTRRLI